MSSGLHRLIMQKPTLKEQGYLPRRYLLAITSCFGMVCTYMLRNNMNMAVVAMSVPGVSNASSGSSEAEEVCGFTDDGDETQYEKGTFEWDEITQSLIIGSYFWGYLFTQVPSGRISELFGPKKVLGISLVLSGILTLFIPLTARDNAIYLIINRFLLGLTAGGALPGNHTLLSSWAPPTERSSLSTIIYAGGQVGTVVGYTLTSVLFTSLGWESVFYVQGAITLVWCALWFIIVADSPREHKSITPAEREYILTSIGEQRKTKTPPVPVKAILTSLPFYAILIAGTSNNWGFYTLLSDMPLYMKNMLLKNVQENAMLSSMPYLAMWIFSLIVSKVCDTLIQKNLLSTGAVRKVSVTLSQVGPALCLLGVTFVKCDRAATLVLFFTAVLLQGFMYPGYMVNHIDISPNFAGTLVGITNSVNTIASWVAPVVAGAFTNDRQTFEQWAKVYYITAAVYVAGTIFYLIFGSGEVQPWNNLLTKEECCDKQPCVRTIVTLYQERGAVEGVNEVDNECDENDENPNSRW